MFGANAFGWPYFSQIYAGVVATASDVVARVGGRKLRERSRPMTKAEIRRETARREPVVAAIDDDFALILALGLLE